MTAASVAMAPSAKALQCGFIVVFCVGEPYSSVGFGGDEHHRLSQAFASDECFVDFNVFAQSLAAPPPERATDFVQPRPGRFVGTEAEDALQFLRRDTIAAGRNLEHGTEPNLERLARAFEDCA